MAGYHKSKSKPIHQEEHRRDVGPNDLDDAVEHHTEASSSEWQPANDEDELNPGHAYSDCSKISCNQIPTVCTAEELKKNFEFNLVNTNE